MCLSCGCMMPTNDHGDDRHITLADVQGAAAAADITVEQAAHNVGRTVDLALGVDPVKVFSNAYDRPTLVFDLDGVLAFLAESLCSALNAKFDASYQAHALTVYRLEDVIPRVQADWLVTQFGQPQLYANSAPDLHAIDVVCDAQQAGYVVRIASDRRVAPLEGVTREWLSRWGVAYDDLHLLGPGGKVAFMQQFNRRKPAVLIDDDPVKQVTIPKPGVQVWTPIRPWTPDVSRPGVWRFADWNTLRQRLEL